MLTLPGEARAVTVTIEPTTLLVSRIISILPANQPLPRLRVQGENVQILETPAGVNRAALVTDIAKVKGVRVR